MNEKYINISLYLKQAAAYIPEIIFSVILLCITWYVARVAGHLVQLTFTKTNVKPALVEFLQKVLSFTVWVCGILLAASIIFPSVTPAKVITALGFGSIAVGLAFKDIFENFMAGVLILLREPFKLKDYIQVDNIIGSVERITIRDTYLKDLDGQRVVVPNAKLFKNDVIVLTYENKRRVSIVCGIAYGEDVQEVKDILLKKIKEQSTVSKSHPVEVRADHFGDSSVNLRIYWYTDSTPEGVRVSIDEIITVIKATLDDKGIEIPFPYRTLTFKNTPNFNIKP